MPTISASSRRPIARLAWRHHQGVPCGRGTPRIGFAHPGSAARSYRIGGAGEMGRPKAAWVSRSLALPRAGCCPPRGRQTTTFPCLAAVRGRGHGAGSSAVRVPGSGLRVPARGRGAAFEGGVAGRDAGPCRGGRDRCVRLGAGGCGCRPGSGWCWPAASACCCDAAAGWGPSRGAAVTGWAGACRWRWAVRCHVAACCAVVAERGTRAGMRRAAVRLLVLVRLLPLCLAGWSGRHPRRPGWGSGFGARGLASRDRRRSPGRFLLLHFLGKS